MSYLAPLLLLPNRVRRTYRGGALLDQFRGEFPGRDDYYPEEWIGSTTTSTVERQPGDNDGRSICVLPDGQQALLVDLLARDGEAFLGQSHMQRVGPQMGMLLKLLDSELRLAIQAHPDRAFSRKYLSSPYGKAEAWIVLDGREIDGVEPFVLFGFQEGVTREQFQSAFDRQDADGMVACLNRVRVQAGDVFIIPGRLPHAIGSGVFCIEPQEPTDFVFRLEQKGPAWNLTPFQMHMDLGPELLMESFDFDGPRGEAIVSQLHRRYDFGVEGVQSLIPDWAQIYFRTTRVATRTRVQRAGGEVVIGICTGGAGSVTTRDGQLAVSRGTTFLVPAAAGDRTYQATDGLLQVFESSPPL